MIHALVVVGKSIRNAAEKINRLETRKAKYEAKLQEVLFMLELEQYKYSLSEIEESIKEIEVSL